MILSLSGIRDRARSNIRMRMAMCILSRGIIMMSLVRLRITIVSLA